MQESSTKGDNVNIKQLCKFKSEHKLLKIYLPPNSYLAINVRDYFDFLNPVTAEIKYFLGFYNLSDSILFEDNTHFKKSSVKLKIKVIYLNIYVKQRRWVCRRGLYLDLSLNLTVVYLIEMTIRNVHLLIHELNVNVLKIDIVIP